MKQERRKSAIAVGARYCLRGRCKPGRLPWPVEAAGVRGNEARPPERRAEEQGRLFKEQRTGLCGGCGLCGGGSP
jgi:hypothetical protein